MAFLLELQYFAHVMMNLKMLHKIGWLSKCHHGLLMALFGVTFTSTEFDYKQFLTLDNL